MLNSHTLITGASEGLGKYLALECARLHMNLVLVALPGSGLSQVANQLKKLFDIQVMAIEQDLTSPEGCNELYEKVKEQGIHIKALINNAGMGGSFYFEEKKSEFYHKLIALNVTAPTMLCRLFLDDLRSNAPSYIMNVGSLAGMFCLPKKQVYGGTKSYLLSFSKSLHKELKRENISVSVVCPGGMNTHWRLSYQNCTTGTWLSKKSIMDPRDVARIAVKGMLNKNKVIIPGLINQLFLFMDKSLPGMLKNWLMHLQMKANNTRREAGIPTRFLLEVQAYN